MEGRLRARRRSTNLRAVPFSTPRNWRCRMNPDDFPAPKEGFVLTHFLVVSDQDRSRDFYKSIFGVHPGPRRSLDRGRPSDRHPQLIEQQLQRSQTSRGFRCHPKTIARLKRAEAPVALGIHPLALHWNGTAWNRHMMPVEQPLTYKN